MQDALYPLRFAPIFKPAIWGGTALRPMFGQAGSAEAEGEAWVLSDQGDSQSVVAEGPLKGRTLRELMVTHEREILGDASLSAGRFPLLLKFLDARQALSVQVHPDDHRAKLMEPSSAGLGKTEAWVILQKDPGALLYSGLKKGVDSAAFQSALQGGTLPDVMHTFSPDIGDCVFLEAGTIHAIGAGLLLFEVQQTSDITYRLYDWGRVDARTGKPRQLHIEQSLTCTDVERGPCGPVRPLPIAGEKREQLVSCRYFTLDRHQGSEPMTVGASGQCRIAVAVEGKATLEHAGTKYPMKPGDVILLPATIGPATITPHGNATILECGPAA